MFKLTIVWKILKKLEETHKAEDEETPGDAQTTIREETWERMGEPGRAARRGLYVQSPLEMPTCCR